MGATNCAVVGCYNNTENIHKWEESSCEVQGVLNRDILWVVLKGIPPPTFRNISPFLIFLKI